MEVSVDFLLGHDPTIALLIDDFRRLGRKIWDRSRVIFTADHFAPPASGERASILKKFLDFARQEEVEHFYLFSGICHQLLVEHPQVGPGQVVIGADSHTVTAGALGCLATGMGSWDILYALVTGQIWLKLEEVARVRFRGALPPYLLGKDLILHLLGKLGESGGVYKVFELYDETENRIPMDGRFSMSNMSVEGGAKAGIFIPDEVTSAYLQEKGTSLSQDMPRPDPEARYDEEWEIEVSDLIPQVALPSSPTRVVPVEQVEGEPIDQAYIGSCTGGRLEDLRLAASILKGRRRDRYTKLIVIPSSQKIYLEALRLGYLETLAEAGAAICNPSCGPCGKIDKGILAEGESCVATSNRNFEGRMGELGSRVFLGSTLTAAASALEGKIVDPRRYL